MRTRFAPSPTGPLHLGHAYSAILAHDMARAEGGDFLLRIEDIDQSRARPEWEEMIYDDLRWLGLSWEAPVMRQSDRLAVYRAAQAELWNSETVFACTCNRRDILAAASAPHEGEPPTGPDGIVYPGTCRAHRSDHGQRPIPGDAALRLDMARAATAPVTSEPPREKVRNSPSAPRP
jgi:glutamyl-Q tRNA(Asp) synthetase